MCDVNSYLKKKKNLDYIKYYYMIMRITASIYTEYI